MDLSKLRDINEQKAHNAVVNKRHDELLLESTKTQEVIAKSFLSLVKYLDGKVTKTEVLNQLREISTPDVERVVTAVNDLHETLKTHENTDLTEVTSVMQQVLEEAKKIPKELPEQKEVKLHDYTSQLKSLEKAVKAVEQVVKQQKLVAEAPIVNLPETVVNVEKPDLKPLQTSIAKVVSAVNEIVIPELDTSGLEKLIKRSNKLLNDLLEKPVSSGGGGGGGRATPYQDSSGIPFFVVVESDGSIPVTIKNPDDIGGGSSEPIYKLLLDDYTTTNVTYVGKAALGSATSAAVWQIQKIDETSGLAITWGGTGAFDQVWDNRATTVVYA